MDEPGDQRTEGSRENAIAGLASIAGAVAVIVYTVVATMRLLRSTGGENAFGTIFFLIIGAVVLFFVTAMLVAGLAALVVKLGGWLEPSGGGGEEAEVEGSYPGKRTGSKNDDEEQSGQRLG